MKPFHTQKASALTGLVAMVALGGCAPPGTARVRSPTDDDRAVTASAEAGQRTGAPGGTTQRGYATWYGPGFEGKLTANGERFDGKKLTAAHRSLPFGSWVLVRRIDNGRTVRVRINDRGPWANPSFIVDLSRAAAEPLGLVDAGKAKVEITVLSVPQ
jgi:rare lipoprotein A